MTYMAYTSSSGEGRQLPRCGCGLQRLTGCLRAGARGPSGHLRPNPNRPNWRLSLQNEKLKVTEEGAQCLPRHGRGSGPGKT